MASLLSRAYLFILVAAMSLSWLAFEQAKTIRLDTSLIALMPDGVASVENLMTVLDQTGSFASAMVVITSPDASAAEHFAADLRRTVLANLEWAEAAEYSEDFSVFERHKLLYLDGTELDALRDRIEGALTADGAALPPDFQGIPVNVHIRTTPPLPPETRKKIAEIGDTLRQDSETRRLFQSGDGEVTLLVVWPGAENSGQASSHRIIADLEAAAAKLGPARYHADLSVAVGGRIYNRVVQFDAVIADLSSAGGWSISLIILLLAIYFRSLGAVPIIVLPLLAGILWTMGLTGLVLGQLNLVTVFLVLILFGLGIDFGIHNLARYREEKAKGASAEEALAAVFRHTGGASLIAAATTCAGFFILMITDFRAFHEFGFIAGSGILLTLVAMYTVLPALLVLGERLGAEFKAVPPIQATILARPFLARPGFTALALLMLTGAALWLATRAEFEDNFGRLQSERSSSHKEMQANISRVFPDGTDRAVLIVDTLAEVEAIASYFEAYIAADTETPTIKKVETFYSFAPVPVQQAERLATIAEIRDLVAERDLPAELEDEMPNDWRSYLDIDGLKPADLPEGLRRVFSGRAESEPVNEAKREESGGHLIYIFNSVSLNNATLARQFADDIREISVGGRIYNPAAEGLVFVDMLNLMKKDALIAILAVSAVTILLVGLFFRRPGTVLLVLAPAALGLTVLFGIMGAFDIRLSIFNMVILPAIIGIGVDNGIHIVHRAREEMEQEGGFAGGMAKAMSRSGGAAAVTTLTTLIGFGGMLSAEMGGLHSLGLVATIGFACCLVATFTALPALAGVNNKVKKFS